MSTISASTTSTTAYKVTADTTGTLVLQTGSTPTTAVTIGTDQVVTFAKTPTSNGGGGVSTNTAYGTGALAANTTGSLNTAVGYNALAANTTGERNDAFGYGALSANEGGIYNSAFGMRSLLANTSGNYNNAFGHRALQANTTGANNVGLGYNALYSNTTASNNTAVGYQAGYSNTTNDFNTFIGRSAGYSCTGQSNTIIGTYAGANLTTGNDNTFVGARGGNLSSGGGAGYAITTGSKNTIIGKYDGNQGGLDIRTANNYIVLSDGDGNPRFWIRYDGIPYSPSAYANTAAVSANCVLFSDGAIGRATSSLKYKREVENATHGLAEVMQLRPVTYKGKSERDGENIFGGLIAEEVHAAGLTEFVQYADDGTPDALAYGNMVSLLVKAIQELKAEFDAYKEAHP